VSIEQRKHIRFSLEIPAIRQVQFSESVETILHQISIGGCLLEWDDNVSIGDEFRLLVQLPNKNFLPLSCKAVYSYSEDGFGIKFLDITKFEQELIAKIISYNLNKKGLPENFDPFKHPREYIGNKEDPETKIMEVRQKREEILGDILEIYDQG
jgi:hypothetical protein